MKSYSKINRKRQRGDWKRHSTRTDTKTQLMFRKGVVPKNQIQGSDQEAEFEGRPVQETEIFADHYGGKEKKRKSKRRKKKRKNERERESEKGKSREKRRKKHRKEGKQKKDDGRDKKRKKGKKSKKSKKEKRSEREGAKDHIETLKEPQTKENQEKDEFIKNLEMELKQIKMNIEKDQTLKERKRKKSESKRGNYEVSKTEVVKIKFMKRQVLFLEDLDGSKNVSEIKRNWSQRNLNLGKQHVQNDTAVVGQAESDSGYDNVLQINWETFFDSDSGNKTNLIQNNGALMPILGDCHIDEEEQNKEREHSKKSKKRMTKDSNRANIGETGKVLKSLKRNKSHI